MYGHRARIAYTSPLACTETFPYEFYKIVPPGVTLVITTLKIVDLTPEEVEQSYELSVLAAADMASIGSDLVVLGGLPINLAHGYDNVGRLMRDTEERIGAPVSSSLSAQLDALAHLKPERIAIVHPFSDDDQQALLMEIVGREKLNLVAIRGMGRVGRELGRIPLQASIDFARSMKREYPDIDLLWLPGPHYAVVEAIATIEDELGITVMSANQAIVWHALRRCGIADRITGYGRLLEEF
jgi:maleate isomerase